MSFNLKGYTPYTFFPKMYISTGGYVNHPPTGQVVINGDTFVGSTLTASNNLSDQDGIGVISYNWFVGGVLASTGAEYTVAQQDVGKSIYVTANYTDGSGNDESVVSQPIGPVIDHTLPVVTFSSLETIEAQPALAGTVSEPAEVVVTIGASQYTATVVGNIWSIPAGTVSALEIGFSSVSVSATNTSGSTGNASGTIIRSYTSAPYGDSIRFHHENGESPAVSGLIYQPGTNAILAGGGSPWAATAGAIVVECSIHRQYRSIKRVAGALLGVRHGVTNAGDIRVEYIPVGSELSTAGRFRCHLHPVGGVRTTAQSPVVPDTIERAAVVCAVSSGRLTVGYVDTSNPQTVVWGTPVTLAGTWVGMSAVVSGGNLCVGGANYAAYPDAASGGSMQNRLYWKGEIGRAMLLSSAPSDAEILQILRGRTPASVVGAGNVRWYLNPAQAGAVNLQAESSIGAVAAMTMLGTVLPGSSMYRTDAGVSMHGIRDGLIAGRQMDGSAAVVQLSGTATSPGTIQVRFLNDAGKVLTDWQDVCPASASWSGWASLPQSDRYMHVECRVSSNPAAIVRSCNRLMRGLVVAIMGQSQIVFGTVYGASPTGGAGNAFALPTGWPYGGDTTGIVAHSINGLYATAPINRPCANNPGLTGSGAILIANYLRSKGVTEPLLIVGLGIEGTSIVDLMNDTTTTRQWSWDEVVLSEQVAKNHAGQYQVSAMVMNWGSSDPNNDWSPYLDAWVYGQTSALTPVINHYMRDGVTYPATMEFGLVPFNRSTPIAPSATTDRSSPALRRESQRQWVRDNGFTLGPDATVHLMDGSADYATHPSIAPDGIGRYCPALAECAAMMADLGSWPGSTYPQSARFVDGSMMAFDVVFSGPDGAISTVDGTGACSGFELSLDAGVTWSRLGFSAQVIGDNVVRITSLSSPFTNSVRWSFMTGSPGGYGVSNVAQWLSGALYRHGFPVSGGANTVYSVA